MAEDLKRGFLRFQSDDFQFLIADDRAVEAASQQLVKQFAVDAAFSDPGNAVEAVQAAALRKAFRDDDFPNDPKDSDDFPDDFGPSYIVESYDGL